MQNTPASPRNPLAEPSPAWVAGNPEDTALFQAARVCAAVVERARNGKILWMGNSAICCGFGVAAELWSSSGGFATLCAILAAATGFVAGAAAAAQRRASAGLEQAIEKIQTPAESILAAIASDDALKRAAARGLGGVDATAIALAELMARQHVRGFRPPAES